MTGVTFDDLPDAKKKPAMGGPMASITFDDVPDAKSAYEMTLDVTRARELHNKGVKVADIRKQLGVKPLAPQMRQPNNDPGILNTIGSGLTAFNETIGTIPGQVLDASTWLSRNTVAPIIDYVAGTDYAGQMAKQPSIADAMSNDMGKVIPRTLPKSKAAEYAAAAGRGAGSAATFAMGGGLAQGARGTAGAVAKLLAPRNARDVSTALVSGAGSGAGGMAGRDIGREYGGEAGAAAGEFAGSLAGGIGAGALTQAGLTPKPKLPSVSDIKAMANKAYKAADDAGVAFTPSAIQRVLDDVTPVLATDGFDAGLHTRTMAVLKRLEAEVGKNHTLKGFDIIRRVAASSAKGIAANPEEKKFAGKIIEAIDNVINNPRPADVLMGDPARGAAALKEARRLWSVKSRAERVESLMATAEHRAKRTYSGGNINNTTRQEIGKLVDPLRPWNSRGFSKAELAQAKKASYGSNFANALRAIGAVGPSGNGLGFMLNAGAALGSSGWTLPLSIAAAAAKHAGENMTHRAALKLGDMIRAQALPQAAQRGGLPLQIPRGVVPGIAGQLVPQVTNQMAQSFAGGDALDKVAMGLGPVPIAGDIAGVANDARNFASGKTPMTAANLGMAALGALPFVPGLAGQAAKSAAKAPEPQGITAYHGSPHTFDKFDMSKIGTGEGAQAYGHGLYFTDTEDVAKGYRNTLSDEIRTVNGQPINSSNPEHYAALKVMQWGPDRALEKINTDLAFYSVPGRSDPKEIAKFKAAAQIVKSGNVPKVEARPAGSMYQVRLNVKPDELLDWDKPIANKKIRDLLADLAMKATGDVNAQGRNAGKDAFLAARREELSGAGVHDSMKRLFENSDQAWKSIGKTPNDVANTKAAVSEALKANGIKGIRYLDGNSRGAGQGSYNYVIFDDKLIDILKRYGIPMAAGTGGAMIVMGANMPEAMAAELGGKSNEATQGQIAPGNIDLSKRPVVKNADGTISTVRSISVNFDGSEYLIPTVSDDGRVLSDDAAIKMFQKTGKHLGVFKNAKDATEYAKQLHENQARTYGSRNQR